jgi:hypothetical protein
MVMRWIVIGMTACGGQASAGDGGTDAPADTSYEAPVFDAGCAKGDPCSFPRDISTFTAPMFVPPRMPAMACAGGQAQGYLDACIGAASTPSTCNAWRTANTTCAACVESMPTDASLGPIVVHPDRLVVNMAGCVAVLNDLACATPLEWVDACNYAACGGRVACSPDPLDAADYATCVKAAATCACKEYTDAVTSRCTMGPASAYTKCADAKTVITTSCGG